MSYKKFINRNGKVYGPYVYSSKRVQGRVISEYQGKGKPENHFLLVLGIILIISAGFLLLKFSQPTGKIVLEVSPVYNANETIFGDLKIKLKPGEFLPSNSRVSFKLNNQQTELPVSQVLEINSSQGKYYAEDINLEGEGEGYGFIGEKISYPEVSFKLLIYQAGIVEQPEIIEIPIPEIPFQENETTDIEPAPAETITPETETVTPATETTTESSASLAPEPAPVTETPAPPAAETSAESSSITGGIIAESKIVEGTVVYGKEYVYDLSSGESATLVQGSIKTAEANLSLDSLRLVVGNDRALVTTSYYKSELGFGREFITQDEKTVALSLEEIGFKAEHGILEVSIVYNDLKIAEAASRILVGEKNESAKQKEEKNQTKKFQDEIQANKTAALEFIKNIPGITILKNTKYELNLEEYFKNADSYFINNTENISFKIEGSKLVIEPDGNYTGKFYTRIDAFGEYLQEAENETGNESFLEKLNETVQSNEFLVQIVEGLAIETKQYKARIGQPVKWKKTIKLEKIENISLEIPAEAENISIKKVIEGNAIELEILEIRNSLITGQVSLELELKRENFLTRFLKKILAKITGKAVADNVPEAENIKIILDENASEYSIEYETPAPQAFEENITNGKLVIVSGPDLNYTDILTYSEIPEEWEIKISNQLKLYWIEDGNSSLRKGWDFDAFDLNNNSFIDYIEWITPHLSDQIFEINNLTVSSITQDTSCEGGGLYCHLKMNETLLLYLPFDVNVTGREPDWSNYNNDGTTISGAFWNNSGKYLGTYVFDGLDDYIGLGNTPPTLQQLQAGNFSVSVWINPKASGGGGLGTIYDNYAADSGGLSILIRNLSGGTVNGMQANIDFLTTDTLTITSNNVVTYNTWQHFVLVFNSNTKNATFYKNGVFQSLATNTLGSGSIGTDSDNDLRIGNIAGGTARTFNGSIDELMIFNYSLSSSEITQIYQEQLPRFASSGNHSINQSITSGNNYLNIKPNLRNQQNSTADYTLISARVWDNVGASWSSWKNLSNQVGQTFSISTTATSVNVSFFYQPDSYKFFSPVLAVNLTLTSFSSNISACQDLMHADATYLLIQNVSSSGTCFNITANDITLDCKGYEINYSSASLGSVYGVGATGYNFSTVKNCVLREGTSVSADITSGLWFSTSVNGTFINNTITTYSAFGHGIQMDYAGGNHFFANNTIRLNNNNAVGVVVDTTTANVTILNNTILTSGADSYGIYIQSTGTKINNNYVITSGSSSYPLYLVSVASNLGIGNNTFISNGANAYGIYFEAGINNNIHGLITRTNASSLYIANSQNFTISDSILNSSGYADLFVAGGLTSGNYNFTNVTRADSQALNISWTSTSTKPRMYLNWYLDLNVTNSSSQLDNANISLRDRNQTLKFSELSDGNGLLARKIIEEYWRNSSTIIFSSLYNITGIKSGYNNYENSTINITRNLNLNIVMNIQSFQDCGELNSANTNYSLTQSISSAGTCFNITANNITLDCQSYGINYSSGGATGTAEYGIKIKANASTIKNCLIKEGTDLSTASSHAVYYENPSYNSTLLSNTIITLTSTSSGVYVIGDSKFNLTSNNITSSDIGIYSYAGGVDLFSLNNIILSVDDGFFAVTLANSTLLSNNITTTGTEAYGINSGDAKGNNLTRNIITTSGSASEAIRLTGAGSNSNIIHYNYLTASGESLGALINLAGSYNNITNNNISTASGDGISVQANNIIKNNLIGAYQSGSGIEATNNNLIENNTIISGSPATGGGGIGGDSGSLGNVNIVRNNIINSTYMGISVSGSYNNFSGNIIRVSGDTSHGVYYSSAVFPTGFNQFENETILISGSSSYAVYLELYTDLSHNFTIKDSILNSSKNQEVKIACDITPCTIGGMWNFTNITNLLVQPFRRTWASNSQGIMNVHWYLDVNVSNSSYSPVSANVSLIDRLGIQNFSEFSSDTTGLISRKTLQEYVSYNASNLTYYTLFNVTASNISYTPYHNATINFTNNLWLNVILGTAGDTTYPLVQLVYPANTSYNINISSLNYTASDASLQACWYSTNNGATNTSVACGTNLTGLTSSEGSNSWLVGANDSSGNRNSSVVSFVKDTILPTINILSPLNSTYNITSLSFNVSTSEPASWCGYKYDTSSGIVPWAVMTQLNSTYYNATKSGMTEAQHYVIFSCNDTTGNLNSSSERRYFVINLSYSGIAEGEDTTGPSITLQSPADGASSSEGTINFQFNVSDSSNIANCSLLFSDVAVQTSGSISKTETNTISRSLSAGSYSWKIGCYDQYSNLGASSSRSILVSSPTPPGGGGGGGGGCSSECSAGDLKCSGSVLQDCRTTHDSDPCYEWGNLEICNQGCSNNACVNQNCTENWACTDWGKCLVGVMRRNCTDSNKCGTSKYKPDETRTCTIQPLILEYSPGELNLILPQGKEQKFSAIAVEQSDAGEIPIIAKWHADNIKIKEEAGINSVISLFKISGAKKVKLEVFDIYNNEQVVWDIQYVNSSGCREDWACEWRICDSNGYSSPKNCYDKNNCGTNADYPHSKKCDENCKPSWRCSDWGECEVEYKMSNVIKNKIETIGEQKRTCEDASGCYNPTTEKRNCNLARAITVKNVEWCNENYVEICDAETKQVVSRIREIGFDKESPRKTSLITGKAIKGVDIGLIVANFTGYCDYCYDNIKNYDETSEDCGGPNCPPCEEMSKVIARDFSNYYKQGLWSLFVLLLGAYLVYLYKARKKSRLHSSKKTHIKLHKKLMKKLKKKKI